MEDVLGAGNPAPICELGGVLTMTGFGGATGRRVMV
jgi:hypothetical protein